LDFPLAPRHRATASLDFNLEDWKVQLRARYESETYDDTNNTRQIPDAFTLDAGVQYRISERLSLRLRAENLLDEIIISAEQAGGVRFIAPGRSYSLGFSMEL
jgi:outer membrane receptor protein involved in Fe transport